MPTHVEALSPEADLESEQPVASGPSTKAIPRDQPVASGPRTAVIPRDAQARGKAQKQTSFATNVDYKSMLDRATPLFGYDAITDDASPGKDAGSPSPDATEPSPPSKPDGDVSPGSSGTQRPDAAALIRKAPPRSVLIVAGLGAIALAVAAVIMFLKSKQRMHIVDEFEDAGIGEVAADAWQPVAPHDASVAVPAPADAGVDAPSPIDARRNVPHDVGHAHHDAQTIRASTDAGVASPPRGNAKLAVGADPWGEIYIDGKSAGRTPREITVTAGRHTVEIVFPAEQPPRKQTFAVDLATGERKSVQADFR